MKEILEREKKNETTIINTVIISGLFFVEEKIGEGAFSQVYRLFGKKDLKKYACKIESTESNHQELYAEFKILQWLRQDANPFGIPKVHYFGVEDGKNVMVLELLGGDLESKLKDCGGVFSLKTVIMILDQVLKRLEYIHARRLIHRDVKPGNIVTGIGYSNQTLYLIDFGKGKKYCDSKGKHIEPKSNKMPIGNLRYGSVNSDSGEEMSRRDDLESLMFCLLHFLKGSLPWMGIKTKTLCEKFKQVSTVKSNSDIGFLCEGLIPEFYELFKYIRELSFDQDPNYPAIHVIVKKMISSQNIQMDYIYDWKLFKSNEKDQPEKEVQSPTKTSKAGQSPTKGPNRSAERDPLTSPMKS